MRIDLRWDEIIETPAYYHTRDATGLPEFGPRLMLLGISRAPVLRWYSRRAATRGGRARAADNKFNSPHREFREIKMKNIPRCTDSRGVLAPRNRKSLAPTTPVTHRCSLARQTSYGLRWLYLSIALCFLVARVVQTRFPNRCVCECACTHDVHMCI